MQVDVDVYICMYIYVHVLERTFVDISFNVCTCKSPSMCVQYLQTYVCVHVHVQGVLPNFPQRRMAEYCLFTKPSHAKLNLTLFF